MDNTARIPSAALAPKWALHILLAEDNRQLRNLLATALYSEGHSVDEVADGGALLEAIATLILEDRADDIDVIISEQELPGMPGLSVLAGLRARGHSIPFVLMTGNEVVQARAKELGAVILDRPFNLGAIQEAIQEASAMVAARRSHTAQPGAFLSLTARRSRGSA